ncbi:amidase [Skermanella stibiiresistens SB22]|uniref:Amidase n=1 Tax=Skermanella stibiiresistens SB22 TaxID=1385369 RepID=W9H9N7_9PROT|nr:creatininase family protein [Skermanella stibiiresistens]EWY40553.1 amidase [Skermanella stibiiresistens SB22]
MRLQLSTWPEVENYLKTSRGIIMPIGSTEQHGPNGLIGTDALCAEEIAWGVGAATGALVGPTIGVGMAVHHMEFPGTVTLRPSTLVLVIRDYVTALADHGFERFLFVNGHGGNIATVRAAFNEIYAELRAERGAEAPNLRCRVISWWESESVHALSRELFGVAEGSHATPSEVSVVQYTHPNHIKEAPLDPPIAPSGPFYDARDYRRRFPDGRIGSNPGLARPEHGKRLYDAAVASLAEKYQKFVHEE